MSETRPVGIFSLHGVRYQVTDVARAATFYTDHLGFRLEHQQLPHLRACCSKISGCCSVGQEHRDLGRCPVANGERRRTSIHNAALGTVVASTVIEDASDALRRHPRFRRRQRAVEWSCRWSNTINAMTGRSQ
jgi:hypothetical protein